MDILILAREIIIMSTDVTNIAHIARSYHSLDYAHLCAGMDRELAEEFIEQTMEPSTTITVTADHHTVSGTESEAW